MLIFSVKIFVCYLITSLWLKWYWCNRNKQNYMDWLFYAREWSCWRMLVRNTIKIKAIKTISKLMEYNGDSHAMMQDDSRYGKILYLIINKLFIKHSMFLTFMLIVLISSLKLALGALMVGPTYNPYVVGSNPSPPMNFSTQNMYVRNNTCS